MYLCIIFTITVHYRILNGNYDIMDYDWRHNCHHILLCVLLLHTIIILFFFSDFVIISITRYDYCKNCKLLCNDFGIQWTIFWIHPLSVPIRRNNLKYVAQNIIKYSKAILEIYLGRYYFLIRID